MKTPLKVIGGIFVENGRRFQPRTELMKVIVTGANGAVGQSVLRCGAECTDEPITFIALVRSDKAAETLKPLLRSFDRVARVSYMATKDLAAAFGDGKALIHLSGILVESATSTYEEAHVTATRSIVEAAKQSVIEKLVLVSAVGADEKSTNGYWRTKGQAEAIIRSSGVAFTILRVPLLLGRGTEGAAALKRNASSKKPKLIGGGRNFQQPLFVDDAAKAAILACRPSVARNRTLELVGPVSISERDLVERAAKVLGHDVRVSSVPKGLMRFALQIGKLIGKRGFSVDALDVITADTRLDPAEASRELRIRLTGVDDMIRSSLELTNG
jgi:uncharacterized protein YbjT (DUF2867 family)